MMGSSILMTRTERNILLHYESRAPPSVYIIRRSLVYWMPFHAGRIHSLHLQATERLGNLQ